MTNIFIFRFDEKGEGAFRVMETECLKEIMGYSEKYVISVGGGLPVKEENRELLKELGSVVYHFINISGKLIGNLHIIP